MSDNGEYEQLVEGLRASAGLHDEALLTQGEIAAAIYREYGKLKQASIDSHIGYKALSQYKCVVEFYNNSTRVEIGNSNARLILDSLDTLHFSHLRIAMGLGDYEEAMEAIHLAADEAMTTRQLERHIAKIHSKNGTTPKRYIIDNERGLKVTISRY